MGLLGWTEATATPLLDVALERPGVKLIANALGTPPKEVIAPPIALALAVPPCPINE